MRPLGPVSKAGLKGSICHRFFFIIPLIGKYVFFLYQIIGILFPIAKKFQAFKDSFTFSNIIQEGCTAGEDPATFACRSSLVDIRIPFLIKTM